MLRRYVILRHDLPPHASLPGHWDLMLETNGVLATWAVAEEPVPGRRIAAERLADHRLDYLELEGPVSGDRGHVTRWDAGAYRTESQSSAAWRVRVRGNRLDGQIALEIAGDQPRYWTFCYVPAAPG